MKKLSILFIVFMSLFSSFAQSNGSSKLTDEEINDLSSKLAMKLLMNDSQESNIKEVLKTYRTELSNMNLGSGKSDFKNKQELISSLDSRIESSLDSKQKIKFRVLEKEWWTSVDAEAGD